MFYMILFTILFFSSYSLSYPISIGGPGKFPIGIILSFLFFPSSFLLLIFLNFISRDSFGSNILTIFSWFFYYLFIILPCSFNFFRYCYYLKNYEYYISINNTIFFILLAFILVVFFNFTRNAFKYKLNNKLKIFFLSIGVIVMCVFIFMYFKTFSLSNIEEGMY